MVPMRGVARKFFEAVKKIAVPNSSPRQIAGSVGVGTFVGCIPITGCQIWLALLLSIIFRVNKLRTVLSLQLFSNPLTLVFICYFDYKIGRFLLRDTVPGITRDYFHGFGWEKLIDIAKPLFLGSIVLACIVAPVAYTATLVAVSRLRRNSVDRVEKRAGQIRL